MTEQVTDGQLDRLDEVIEELESERLPEDDAPDVSEAADEEPDDGFEEAGEEEHQEEKRKTDGLTRNQRRAQTRYDKIYREKREAQEKAAAAEARLKQTEQEWSQHFADLSKQLESLLSGSPAGEPGSQAPVAPADVETLVAKAVEKTLSAREANLAEQQKMRALEQRRQNLESVWKPIYERVEKSHPAVAGWFYNDFSHDVRDVPEKLEILEAAQELDYPMESLYAAAADESFGRLSLGGKIKLIAKASKKIAARKSQPSKADNPIEIPNSVGAKKGPQTNEEIWLAITGRK